MRPQRIAADNGLIVDRQFRATSRFNEAAADRCG